MIRIENVDVYGWAAAIRGMRNPYESWNKSDSVLYENNYLGCCECPKRWEDCSALLRVNNGCFKVGQDDLRLMRSLAKSGTDHSKFARMITVTCDIIAPLYWYKAFDAYKVGTVANSCSTMHKIHAKRFTLGDFSCEHLGSWKSEKGGGFRSRMIRSLETTIKDLNYCRERYLETEEKEWWWKMIQLLPSSYNQKRTIQLNYQVLWSMYQARKNHKLDEWRDFCKWIEELPYFKEIYLND